MKRRNFLALTAAAGAGLYLPKAVHAHEFDHYVPKTKNYLAVHKKAIVIDGAVPLLAGTFNPKHIDWWIEGGLPRSQ